jgi:hypothetical protein
MADPTTENSSDKAVASIKKAAGEWGKGKLKPEEIEMLQKLAEQFVSGKWSTFAKTFKDLPAKTQITEGLEKIIEANVGTKLSFEIEKGALVDRTVTAGLPGGNGKLIIDCDGGQLFLLNAKDEQIKDKATINKLVGEFKAAMIEKTLTKSSSIPATDTSTVSPKKLETKLNVPKEKKLDPDDITDHRERVKWLCQEYKKNRADGDAHVDLPRSWHKTWRDSQRLLDDAYAELTKEGIRTRKSQRTDKDWALIPFNAKSP